MKSDFLFLEPGFQQFLNVPQMFYIQSKSELQMVSIKVVDDINGRRNAILSELCVETAKHVTLGTSKYQLDKFRFIFLTFDKDENSYVTVNGDE